MSSAKRPRDEGSASVELVILFPALLLIVTALIQYGLWFHAQSVATAAAQEGVAAGRALDAGPGVAQASALSFIAAHGSDTLVDATATSAGRVGEITVMVTGRSLSVVPGVGGLAVQASAHAPVERFVREDAG